MKLTKAESYHPWVISLVGADTPAWQAWSEALLAALRQTGQTVGYLCLATDQPEANLLQRRAAFLECDLLVIASKGPEIGQAVFQDTVQDPIIRLHCLDAAADVAALPTPVPQDTAWQAVISPNLARQTALPQFHPEDLQGLLTALSDALASRLAQIPLYGLILAGGRSRRMQADKALLNYHGQSQLAQTYGLLSPICSQVLISCRETQAETDWPLDPGLPPLPWSYDRFSDLGPLGGILTAMMAHPQAAFLVVAVDLPWLDLSTLAHLIQARRPLGPATAFLSSHDGLPEPLCAIYEPRMRERLFALLGLGFQCPRKALLHSASQLIPLPEPFRLDNANTPEDFATLSQAISESQAGSESQPLVGRAG